MAMYLCRYCNRRDDDPHIILAHTLLTHNKEELKIRKREIQDEKPGYRTITYQIIPNRVYESGKLIWIRPGSTDIKILDDPESLNSPLKKKPREDLNGETVCASKADHKKQLIFDDEKQPENENSDEVKDPLLEEVIALIPNVLQEFRKHGQEKKFLLFMRLVESESIPLENIAWLLFLDVMQWFSLETTSQMRYSDTVKSFWTIGMLLFGHRFLHFLGGLKNKGQTKVHEALLGECKPDTSQVNFVCPEARYLLNDDEDVKLEDLQPGILHAVVDEYVARGDVKDKPHNSKLFLQFMAANLKSIQMLKT